MSEVSPLFLWGRFLMDGRTRATGRFCRRTEFVCGRELAVRVVSECSTE